MLQEYVHYYHHQVNELKHENEELEQYGRRLCVTDAILSPVENETSGEVLDKVMPLMQAAECDIPETVHNGPSVVIHLRLCTCCTFSIYPKTNKCTK